MKSKLHAIAGTIAMFCIATFWLSSAYVELAGGPQDIAMVKTTILWGMAVLIPSMMAVGASGFSLGKAWKSKIVGTKKLRMKFIAANGMIILLPSAVFLAMRAQGGQFDALFYSVQFLELAAGATNLALLSLNMRDGLAIARNRRQKQ